GFAVNGDIYVGTRKGHVILSRDMLTQIPAGLVAPEGEGLRSVAFSPDGRRVAIGKSDKLLIEDMDTGKIVWQFADKPELRDTAFLPDGKLVAVASGEQVYLLDAATGKIARVVRVSDAAKPMISLSPDGRLIAVAGEGDAAIHLIELASGRIVVRLTAANLRVRHLAFSPDGRMLAAGDDSGTVRVFVRGAKSTSGARAEAGDRIDQLVAQLAKSGRSNDQCIEALFLTMFGRFPQETEARIAAERLNKASDRKEALLDVLFALQNSKEFKAQLEALQKRREQLPIP
ncbi:MAG: WD40 repeat domain-containing protein, partial [Gemmataceae bacterium]